MTDHQTRAFDRWIEAEIADAEAQVRRLAKRDGIPPEAIGALLLKLRGKEGGDRMTENQTSECTEAALLHPATGQGTAESPSLASVRQTNAAREAEASLPPVKLDLGSHRFTHCQATEDDCTYERCPRWRDGHLISRDHCAFDLVGADEESY